MESLCVRVVFTLVLRHYLFVVSAICEKQGLWPAMNFNDSGISVVPEIFTE